MRLSKLFKKTLLVFIVLFGVIALTISLVSALILYQRLVDENRNKALSIANSITRSGLEVLLNQDAAAIQSLIDNIIDIEGVAYVLYVTRDKEIIAHTFVPEVPAVVEKVALAAQEDNDRPMVHGITIPGQGDFFCIGSPVLSGSAGYIHIGISKTPVADQIRNTLLKMQGLTLVIFLICVVAAYLLMDRISRPLTELTDYAQRIAGGDFSGDIRVHTGDEIETLARNMKGMGYELQNMVENLEQAVAHATEELHDALNHLGVIFDHVADGLVVTDQGGVIVRHNHQLLRMFGLPASTSLVGQKVRPLLGITIRELAQQTNSLRYGTMKENGRDEDVLIGRSYQDIEYVTRRADGTPFTVELSVSSIRVGRGFNNIAVIRDITRRKMAETELKRTHELLEKKVLERTSELSRANENLLQEVSERRKAENALASEKELLTTTLRSIGDGVITVDTSGRVVLMNRVAESLTGYPIDEAEGRPLAEIFPVHKKGSMQRHDLLTDEIGKAQDSLRGKDLYLQPGAGREIEISHSLSPIVDPENKRVGSVLVFRDITLERKIEEENIKAQKLTSLGILAGGIAHDFNNILTAILNNIALSRLQLETDSGLSRHLQQAEAATRRAQKLTIQLLTFSKGGDPVREVTSFVNLVEESRNFALGGTNVSSEVDIAADLWPVEVDKGQISQVLDNLLINGAQAMSRGGTIFIRARNWLIDESSPTPLTPGAYIKCQVIDEGCGIEDRHLERIFDPYFTTKDSGSGLGLATSYSIIKNHHGLIEVDSEVGKGTTFTFYLPARMDEVTIIEQGTADEVVAGKGTVLVMDDEESVRAILGDALDFLGYKCLFACNGEEALAIYTDEHQQGRGVDLVIMDLTIPGGKGGKETVGELLQRYPQARVIVSSGYSRDPVMANYARYGFCGVLVKPYSIEELSRKIREVMVTGA